MDRLKTELRSHGLKVSGRKAMLVQRLSEATGIPGSPPPPKIDAIRFKNDISLETIQVKFEQPGAKDWLPAQLAHSRNDGRTPLAYAVEGGRPDVVRYLLEKHSDPTLQSAGGKLALDAARDHLAEADKLLAAQNASEDGGGRFIMYEYDRVYGRSPRVYEERPALNTKELVAVKKRFEIVELLAAAAPFWAPCVYSPYSYAERALRDRPTNAPSDPKGLLAALATVPHDLSPTASASSHCCRALDVSYGMHRWLVLFDHCAKTTTHTPPTLDGPSLQEAEQAELDAIALRQHLVTAVNFSAPAVVRSLLRKRANPTPAARTAARALSASAASRSACICVRKASNL